ncbi:MAG: phosphatase PAP2 family protein [Acidobacteriota bacterium]
MATLLVLLLPGTFTIARDTLGTAAAPTPAPADERHDGLASDLGAGFRSLVRPRGHHWRRFWMEMATIGAAGLFDHEARTISQRNRSRSTDRIGDDLRPFGSVIPLVGFGITWVTGKARHDEKLRALGADGLEASFISGVLLTPGIKRSVGRSRPAQDRGTLSFQPFGGDSSFPAGEPTEAFTAAAVLSQHLENRWLLGAAWGTAGLVGVERMNFDRHWLSDVTASAFLGLGTARFLKHRHAGPADRATAIAASRPGHHVAWSPITRGDRRGLMLRIAF